MRQAEIYRKGMHKQTFCHENGNFPIKVSFSEAARVKNLVASGKFGFKFGNVANFVRNWLSKG